MNLILLKSGKENAGANRTVQYCRNLVQWIVLALLVAGLYTQVIRAHTLVVLVLALLAGNFFCGWLCPYVPCRNSAAKLARCS